MPRLIAESERAQVAGEASARMDLDKCTAPLLTVIVPVYNEVATVNELLRRVVEMPLDMQVIVVDDGSTDGTIAVLEGWEGHPRVELLAHARNRGKGAAIRTALEQARGRYAIVQDADLEYDPRDYERLLAPMLEGSADVVYGSRYMPAAADGHGKVDPALRDGGAVAFGGGQLRHGVSEPPCAGRVFSPLCPTPPPWTTFRLGVCLLNVAARWIYGARLTDEATCYKAFSTDVLRTMELKCERFEFCPEVTAKACRMNLRIVEVPVRYSPRGAADGKKIRCRDGWEALRTLWRWRNWDGGRRKTEDGRRKTEDGRR